MLYHSSCINFKQGVFEFLIMITLYSSILYEFIVVLLVHSLPQFFKCFKFGYEEIYQVNLEKSSTHTYEYLFSAILSTCIGPIRSMWTNSSTLVVEPS